MDKEKLRGVYAPVLTPIKHDQTIDIARLRHLCHWLMENHVGIVLFGTTSEATSFSAKERMNALDALLKTGISAKRMMVGTGCCSIDETVLLTHHAAKNGCPLSLMLPPFYYHDATNEGLIRFYSDVIETLGEQTLGETALGENRIGICLYHIPQLSGVRIDYDIIKKLYEKYPSAIVGIKDSSGDRSHLIGLITAFPQLLVYPGSEAFLLQGLRYGAAGCISATANVNAPAIMEIWDAYQNGKTQTQQDSAQHCADKIRHTIETYPLIPALKYILATQTNDPNWQNVRPPLMSLHEKYGKTLTEELKIAGFLSQYPPFME